MHTISAIEATMMVESLAPTCGVNYRELFLKPLQPLIQRPSL